MKSRAIAALAASAILGSALFVPVATAQAAPPKSCSDTMRRDIPRGDPDYAPRLDRDNDGLACESADLGPGQSGTPSASATPTRTSTARPTKSPSTGSTTKASSGGLARTGV